MKNNASIKPILYTHKVLSNGKHPIILQVIKDRKVKRISLGYSATKDQWDFKNHKPNRKYPYQKELQAVISMKKAELDKQALTLALENQNYSADALVKTVQKNKNIKSVFKYFEDVVTEMKKANRIGNAEVYNTCKNVLFKFNQEKDLRFYQIDYAFINKFENTCKANNWKESSISSYLRTLRALFNRAINEKIITPDVYPFRQYKIGKLNTETQKRAISEKDIQKIERIEVKENLGLHFAKNVFLFSYYTMGTNLVDIAKITWDDVEDGRLRYVRAKTKKPYNIVLTNKAKEILNFYKRFKTDNYIFPIYSTNVHITAQQKANRLHKVMKNINLDLKEIALACDIKENLTTYVARHSAATILKRKNIPTAVISELMGHETEEITQVYLDSFEKTVLDSALALL